MHLRNRALSTPPTIIPPLQSAAIFLTVALLTSCMVELFDMVEGTPNYMST